MAREFHTVEIRLEKLLKSFGEVTPIDNIDLHIKKGEFLTLLGPSGCGKTTTLRCIAGLEKPTSGNIYFDGQRINDVPPNKRDTGFVFQNWALFPHLSVASNIAFGLELRRMSKKEINRRVDEALELVRLSGLDRRYPAQLSGGQQQRVAVARALVIRPKVLLFDEPLSNLDAKLRKEMRIELKTLHEKLRITIIYVTHDQTEALALSHRIALLYEGRIQQLGTPIGIYNYPTNLFVADFMGFENFIDCRIVDISIVNSRMSVQTDFQKTFVLQNVHQLEKFSISDRIKLAIRGENIKMVKIDDRTLDGPNLVKAKINAILYNGDLTNYYIVPEKSKQELIVKHEGPPTKDKGERVILSVPPKFLIPIKIR